eukprot:TCONS_00023972-protein
MTKITLILLMLFLVVGFLEGSKNDGPSSLASISQSGGRILKVLSRSRRSPFFQYAQRVKRTNGSKKKRRNRKRSKPQSCKAKLYKPCNPYYPNACAQRRCKLKCTRFFFTALCTLPRKDRNNMKHTA